jgi:hypothetical protein
MRLLLPKRYSVEDATFSRTLIAYDETQKLAGIEIPRIIKTAYGKTMMIEESQTNLFPVAYSRQFTSNWTSGTLNGTYTVKIYGSVGSLDLSGGYTGSIAAGETLTFAVSSATVTFTPTDDPVYCSLVLKSYITSWAESFRAAESLTLPTIGLSVSQGTIEGIVEITDVTKRTNAYSYLFHLVCPAGFVVFRHSISANWQINFADGISEYSGVVADSLTPNGLYYYKFYWDIGENKVVLEIWSLSARTKAGNIILTPNYFPTLFGDVIYIGRYISGLHSNARFGRHCLSDIARTDDPDFNNLMPSDVNTTAIFDPTYTFLT